MADLTPLIVVMQTAGAFVPFHQGMIEAWKLCGYRTRRYWDALFYVVYGNERHICKRSFSDWIKGFLTGIPTTIDKATREKLKQGPQERLIQSFLLRSLGESPIAEISDADVRNVVDIAILGAPDIVREVFEGLDQLLRKEIRLANDAITTLEIIAEKYKNKNDETSLKVIEQLKEWQKVLENKGENVNPVFYFVWQNEFTREFLSGVIRAEKELGNALKAAEFMYNFQIKLVSASFALFEAILIVCWLNPVKEYTLIGGAFSFGVLFLGSAAGKGLLDAVIGIGSRFKR